MDILVIEDEWALRRTTVAALSSCGHKVVAAENGAEALARVDACRPDLVLLDLHLPVMDGREFLRHFRARPECAQVPVVVLSAERNSSHAQLGIQAFFAKPFDLEELLDTVNRLNTHPILNGRHAARSIAGSPAKSP